jgi:phage tail sheath protein FI
MAFQVSPGVNISEVDLTNVVPPVSTSDAAFAAAFQWGPIDYIINITSENQLAEIFGKPDSDTAINWLTAASFLSYAGSLQVVRSYLATGSDRHLNSADTGTAALIKNIDHFSQLTGNLGGKFYARYAGTLGDNIDVSVCMEGGFGSRTGASAGAVEGATSAGATTVNVEAGDGSNFKRWDTITFAGDTTEYTITSISTDALTIRQKGGKAVDGLKNDVADAVEITATWGFAHLFDSAPTTSTFTADAGGTGDEIHLVVVDATGKLNASGIQGYALEKYSNLSGVSDARKPEGGSNYYKDVLRDNSIYVYAGDGDLDSNFSETSTASGLTSGTSATITAPSAFTLSGGKGDNGIANGGNKGTNRYGADTGYGLFRDAESTDVGLIFLGEIGETASDVTLVQNVIDNVAEVRKDCVVFFSPASQDVVITTGSSTQTTNVTTFKNAVNRNTSYAFMDSGWKRTYDRYNDTYKNVPLNGDIAGLCVRTDQNRDAWFSPAGFSRGQIKNAIKLWYNPVKTERDTLYKAGINPVVGMPGQGILLFGDKTLLSKPSAFDRLNVRRLFIVLEKAISRAAKFSLFEFNDEFTRAQFKNMVEPFLRDIKARRGIYDFQVVCDGSNNTASVIDRNEFVGDIFIKPARSINFIQLNFVAVGSGVDFSEVAGSV